ncbi:hypothetical protein OH76DRAFT_1409241 [Lentinus brumalis]|uniref:F-box domain-containing protein n=1 Tax=Lentinus brumalis TaxID=2498619 RepID=A0A371CVH4_9APHY|nr:hypothetical protein OH76DRAFT_1409241 [Polyporus brumalis]
MNQVLYDDILLQIFDYIAAPTCDRDASGRRNLVDAALVCRSWTRPAQAVLYAGSILVNLDADRSSDFDWQRASMSILFVRTMCTCPHLRFAVRDITLRVPVDVDTFNDNNIEWLRMLPPDGLRKFRCLWYTAKVPFQPSLLTAPAVLTVHDVRLYCCHKIPMSSVLSLKSATCLDIEIYTLDDHLGHSQEIAFTFESGPPVNKLALNMLDYPGHCQCFAALAPGLRSFTTKGDWFTCNYLARPVGQAIARHGCEVRELILCVDWTARWRYAYHRVSFLCDYPFLDDLATRRPKVEHLVAPPGSCTDVFFEHFPARLKTLELVLQDEKPFPFEGSLREALIRVRNERIPIAVEKIMFWSFFACTVDDDPYVLLRDICAASGITFCHKAQFDPLTSVEKFFCCKVCCPEA